MTIKELFDFVTDITITDIDVYLDKAMDIASNRCPQTQQDKIDEEVYNHKGGPT